MSTLRRRTYKSPPPPWEDRSTSFKVAAALAANREWEERLSKHEELAAESEAGGEDQGVQRQSKAPVEDTIVNQIDQPSTRYGKPSNEAMVTYFTAPGRDTSAKPPRRAISPPPPGKRAADGYIGPFGFIENIEANAAEERRRRQLEIESQSKIDQLAQGQATVAEAEPVTADTVHEEHLPRPGRRRTRFLSMFRKNKQATNSDIQEEQSPPSSSSSSSSSSDQTVPFIKVEPRPTSFGLAHIFTYQELNKATNCFKEKLGEGGFSTVFLGKLGDERRVAVKVLYEGSQRFQQFFNEVTVLSRLHHKNLVTLYGCTDPETQKMLLVYEFMPNGTIADHLHGQLQPLIWSVRMQIAVETAEGLTYLHSRDPPIIHRDVKTSNILLDHDFHAKIADLGMCRLVPWDTTCVTTQPQGTQGYRDPEYDLYCNLTDKSDVYSFGVVLLELISGKQAVDVNREKSEIYLFRMALNKILNKKLAQLIDPELAYHSDTETRTMINSVAELASVCLQPEAKNRPSMVEVLSVLKRIQDGPNIRNANKT